METMTSQDQLDRAMLLAGRSLVTRLFVLLKTAQNYAEGHAAVTPIIGQLLAVLQNLHRMNAEAALRLKGGYLYLGDLRLKPDSSGFEAFKFTIDEMKRCGLGGLSFSPEVTSGEISTFVQFFLKIQPLSSPLAFAELQRLLLAAGMTSIEAEALTERADYALSEDGAKMDSKSRAKRIYSQAISAVDEITGCAAKGKSLRLAKAKRVVQGLVDQLLSDPADLIVLAVCPGRDGSPRNHAVNVSILAVLTGLKAGLAKSRACELGLTAFCHDIGKSSFPRELLEKESDLDEAEWQEMRKHPFLGVKLLMELKQFDPLSARMIAGVFEHHLLCDFSGYPRLHYRKMGLFARIISIADDFDAFTSARIYGRQAKAPEKVIRYLLSRAGKAYDPGLLKLFVSSVGIYPVGTFLLLSSREIGVVVRNKDSLAALPFPWVKVITSATGAAVEGELLDLAELPASGRSLAGSLDGALLGIDSSRFIS